MTIRPNSPAARDIASVLHPYTHLPRHGELGPLVVTEGAGVSVIDETGKSYIDAMAGLWCAALGFNEPRLAAAAERQMRKLPFYHLFTHKSHEPAIQLAEELLKIAPAPMSKAFFANSGSEANDSALKMIWYRNNALGKTAKKKIIARKRGYHGVTIGAGGLTALPANQAGFEPPPAWALFTDCPHAYHEATLGESDEDFANRLAENLDRLIEAEGPETVAALIAEPVMGAGGVVVPPATYFKAIQPVLTKHDVLLVADEVICGFGRTGNVWGSQTFGFTPDIITCAKALSSGYLPISAVLVSEKVYAPLAEESGRRGTFGHGFTYSGHPVAAAVALEALAIYRERDVFGHVRKVAPRLQNGLRRFAQHPLVGEARGIGLIGAIELVKDKERRENFPGAAAVGPYLMGRAQEHGLITRSMFGDSIAFSPPLVITEAEIDEMLRRFAMALDDTWAYVQERGLLA